MSGRRSPAGLSSSSSSTFFLYTIVPTAAQYKLLTDAGGQGATVTPAELYAAIVPLFGAPEGPQRPQPQPS